MNISPSSSKPTYGRWSPSLHGFLAGLVFFSLIIICLSVTNRVGHTVLKESLDEDLKSVAKIAAEKLDVVSLGTLRDHSQQNGPVYAKVVAPLRQMMEAAPQFSCIYTMHSSPQGLRYGVDGAEPIDDNGDGILDQAQLAEIVPTIDPAMQRALSTGRAQVSSEPYQNKWGTFISAYAPLRNPNGEIVGLVGIDTPAVSYLARIARMNRQELVGGLAALIASIGFGLGVFNIQRRRIRALNGLSSVTKALEETISVRNIALAELHEQEQFLQETMDALPFQIAVLDMDANIIAVNHAWDAFALANNGSLVTCGVGSNYLGVCQKASQKNSEEAIHMARELQEMIDGTRESCSLEYPCHAPRERRWFVAHAARFSGDGPLRIVVSHIDITARKLAELNLERSRNELENRVVERTVELEKQRVSLILEIAERKQAEEAAYKASQAKSEFISRMSHELRTPLNAVIGFAQLQQLQSDDPLTIDSAESILKGGRHLLRLVNELLDMAKIESGTFAVSMEPIGIEFLVRQALDLIGTTADESGIAIKVDWESLKPIHAVADQQRLLQVVLNLLSNAIKYNRTAGEVRIRAFTTEGGRVRIKISDTGVGFPKESIASLFVPFERLNRNQADGTGLGLSVSQKLMEHMNGSLELTETSEAGSTFAIDLEAVPETVEPEITPVSMRPDGSTGRKLRVVYIEDNVSNLQLLERLFESVGGVELITAMQGSIGIKLVEQHHPDLVLLDLHLPDTHGLKVLQHLQSNPATSGIPVVVLSADASPNQVKEVLSSGAKNYLTKPIDLQLLLAEMKSIKLPLEGSSL